MKRYRYTTIDNESIEFRGLSAEESDKFYNGMLSGNPFAEEFIFDTITDSKYDINELYAGIVPFVVYASFKLSGYYSKHEDVANFIDNAREQYENNIYHKMFYSKIMKIAPGTYKLEELKDKTLNELLELYVLMESILDAKLHDTNKMREALKEDASNATNKKGKVLSKITKEELSALKAVLQANEFDGAPIESI